METNGYLNGGKAIAATATQKGDILVSGYVVVYDGLDLDGENFLPGSLKAAIKPFLAGSAPLLFNHDPSVVLGKVIDLFEDAKGVFLRAVVHRQEPNSPLRWLVNAVKRGSVKGLSCGGFFKRGLVAGRRMITDVRLGEVSLAPIPRHEQTGLLEVQEVKSAIGRDEALRAARLAYERDLLADLSLAVTELQLCSMIAQSLK